MMNGKPFCAHWRILEKSFFKIVLLYITRASVYTIAEVVWEMVEFWGIRWNRINPSKTDCTPN